ncbi:MAG: hypothetical protein ACP5OB_08380, partial [Candidatus Ratteibacteria bacterium]
MEDRKIINNNEEKNNTLLWGGGNSGVITETKNSQGFSITPSFQKLYQSVNEHFIIPPSFLKVVIGGYICNFLEDIPFWLLIISPSGSGKTQILNLLEKLPNIVFLSEITPNTFISGLGEDKSLLFNLPKPAILIFKDFTTLLTQRPDKRSVIEA